MTTGLMPARIVHLHVTRRCNLACSHCYSASSPQATEALDPATVLSGLEVLRGEGYCTVALSGGEPFLHPQLPEIARGARALGFRVTVISNGVLINERILDTMRDVIDSVAISFDGRAETHNRIRGRKDAYDRAVRTLDALRARGIAFALSCTAAHGQLEDVVALYELADEKGAVAMQVSPIVAVGRGATGSADGLALTEEEKARLYTIGKLLDQEGAGPRVRVELQPQCAFRQAHRQFGILKDRAARMALSDLVNPLVITETGALQPFAYGLARDYDIGHLAGDLPSQIAGWRRDGLARVRSLVERSLTAECVRAQDFVEWYADLVRLSFEDAAEPGAQARERSLTPAR